MNRASPRPGDLIHVVRSTWSPLKDGEWLRVCEQPYWAEEGKVLNVAPRSQVRVFWGPDHGPPDGIKPEHMRSSGGPFRTVRIEDLVGLKVRCTAVDRFWCWKDLPRKDGGMERPVTVTIWCSQRLADSGSGDCREPPKVTWTLGNPTLLPIPDDTSTRPDSLPADQVAAFDDSVATGRIRLGCVHCDREDFDGVSDLPNDWQNVTEMQSWEESIRPVEPDDSDRCVHDWQTHLGICPKCIAILEQPSDGDSAELAEGDSADLDCDFSSDVGPAVDETDSVHPIIRQIIDRDCHVGTSNREVVRHVISKLRDGYRTFRDMPLADRQQLIEQCIQHHASNLHLYLEVMTGSFRPQTKKAETQIPPSTLTGPQFVSLMRKHKVTIAGLAFRLGSTQKRVRQVRETGLQDPHVIRDWMEAITGHDPGPVPERYRVNGIREETECCFCGYPMFHDDDAWEYVGQVFCSISCCRKSHGW